MTYSNQPCENLSGKWKRHDWSEVFYRKIWYVICGNCSLMVKHRRKERRK